MLLEITPTFVGCWRIGFQNRHSAEFISGKFLEASIWRHRFGEKQRGDGECVHRAMYTGISFGRCACDKTDASLTARLRWHDVQMEVGVAIKEHKEQNKLRANDRGQVYLGRGLP